jgi:hypothetical protein
MAAGGESTLQFGSPQSDCVDTSDGSDAFLGKFRHIRPMGEFPENCVRCVHPSNRL